MTKRKIIAIVQARLTSKRFPNKVINKIGDFTIIELIYKRLKRARLVNQIVFAIPSNNKNKKLYDHLIRLGANIYKGSENNVLDRYYKTAKIYNATDIVRITADCPLADPRLVDEFVRKFKKEKHNIT